MITFQDFEKATNIPKFLAEAISVHQRTELYKVAKSANNYNKQRNETIYNYVQIIFSLTGTPIEDFTASNNKIASNFFHRLNTQRCTYLLGNGVSFTDNKRSRINKDGVEEFTDTTKEKLGKKFDNDLKKLTYNALIHGVSFGFWNYNRLYVFPVTEFVPLYDEETNMLRAGIRFWQIDETKPTFAVLYEEDGYTKFKSKGIGFDFEEIKPKSAYKTIVQYTEFDGEEVVGEENYGRLPIVPMWGNNVHQSTLIGMRRAIDSFDLIRSGFANDLTDCAQIYWIIENCMGMSDEDLAKFRDRLKINHIAVADISDESKVTPYAQDIPYQARKEYLDHIRAGIYEDFGGLDVHTIAAGATNDHIDAAYQPMDEEADDLEFQVGEFIEQLLHIIGVEDTPMFKRNRISNEKEQTEMVLSAADYLDDETVLQKLPFITIDEVATILAKKNEENMDRFENAADTVDSENNEDNEENEIIIEE